MISLLSWSTSQVWLINETNLVIFASLSKIRIYLSVYFSRTLSSKINLTIKFLTKRIESGNENILFQIDSVCNTTKNVDKNFLNRFSKLNYLVKNDGRSIDNRRHIEQAEQSDKQNGKGRIKNVRRPRFLS